MEESLGPEKRPSSLHHERCHLICLNWVTQVEGLLSCRHPARSSETDASMAVIHDGDGAVLDAGASRWPASATCCTALESPRGTCPVSA